jgi:hypothetical protein
MRTLWAFQGANAHSWLRHSDDPVGYGPDGIRSHTRFGEATRTPRPSA